MHVKVQKESQKGQIEAPVSHGKHCSWSALSIVPPYIQWLCDITLCHHVTQLHNICLAASLICFGAAALFLLAVSHVWPDQSEQTGYSGGGFLKRQELQQSVSDRGGTSALQYQTAQQNALKQAPILVVTQNKIMTLKASMIYLIIHPPFFFLVSWEFIEN